MMAGTGTVEERHRKYHEAKQATHTAGTLNPIGMIHGGSVDLS